MKQADGNLICPANSTAVEKICVERAVLNRNPRKFSTIPHEFRDRECIRLENALLPAVKYAGKVRKIADIDRFQMHSSS